MSAQQQLSTHFTISPPFSLKRASTTATATDSSTASSADNANGELQRKRTRQRDTTTTINNQPRGVRYNIGDSCATKSTKRSTISMISSSSSSSSKNNNNRPRKRSVPSSVSFGVVTVREYKRSLGDWWDIKHGLCLGWEYVDIPAVPLPDDVVDENENKHKNRGKESKLVTNIKKVQTKIIGMILVSRKKRNSMGTISVKLPQNKTDKAVIRTRTKKKARRRKNTQSNNSNKTPTYEDNKPTPKCREELLKSFGFSFHELDRSEAERKLLRFEHSHWTRMSQNPSPLFLQRCLAAEQEAAADADDDADNADADAATTAGNQSNKDNDLKRHVFSRVVSELSLRQNNPQEGCAIETANDA